MSLLLAVLAAEAFLHLVLPIPFSEEVEYTPDDRLGVRLTPDRTYRLRNGGTCTVNAAGYRGVREPLEPRDESGVRILVLGGSSTFCYETDDDAIWTRLLEKRLSADYQRPVEVINAGVPGYAAFISRMAYEDRHHALQPDIVLVYHTWNDMKFYRRVERDGDVTMNAWRPSRFKSLLRHSQIAWRFRNFLHGVVLPRQRENNAGVVGDIQIPHAGRAHTWERDQFKAIVDRASRDGGVPVLLSQPSLVRPEMAGDEDIRAVSYVEYIGMTFEQVAEQWEATTAIIAEVAADRAVPFVDVRARVPATLDNFRDHVHLTAEGNRRVADAIADGFAATQQLDQLLRMAPPRTPARDKSASTR